MFEGRLCVVTGAAAGIGEATARLLARRGAKLILADIDAPRGTALEAELRSGGASAQFVRTDIGELKDLHRLRDVVGESDVVGSLINIASKPLFATQTAEFDIWRQVFQWSVASYAVLSTLLRPHMARGSSIVNMSSISALRAQKGYGTYAASKAAVLSLTRSQAVEFGCDGIRVNAVCPGTVWTENNARHIGEQPGLDRAAADTHPDFGGRALLRRCADPNEIAEAIAFLASDAASYITGTELLVDGGYCAT